VVQVGAFLLSIYVPLWLSHGAPTTWVQRHQVSVSKRDARGNRQRGARVGATTQLNCGMLCTVVWPALPKVVRV